MEIGDKVNNLAGTLGEHITAIRKAMGWSKSRLAKKAGVSPSVISNLEAGKNKNPSIKTLLKISRALGVSISELLQKKKTSHRSCTVQAPAILGHPGPSESAPTIEKPRK